MNIRSSKKLEIPTTGNALRTILKIIEDNPIAYMVMEDLRTPLKDWIAMVLDKEFHTNIGLRGQISKLRQETRIMKKDRNVILNRARQAMDSLSRIEAALVNERHVNA